MDKEGLKFGTKAVGYDPEEKRCYVGVILNNRKVELSGDTIHQCQLLTPNLVDTKIFDIEFLFTKEDLNGKELEKRLLFEFQLRYMYETDPQEAITMIVQGLLAME